MSGVLPRGARYEKADRLGALWDAQAVFYAANEPNEHVSYHCVFIQKGDQI